MARSSRPTLFPIVRGLAALALVAVAASGCSSLRSVAGLDKSATPDEFQVVSRAPLSIPPDFGLRAPEPGAQRPQETSATDRARQIVIDRQGGLDSAPTIAGLSPSESALLRQAGAADPNIRREVDRETSSLAQADRRWIDSLLFWKTAPEPGEVVDAEKESARLRENAALNRPLSQGETPSIKKKRTALFVF
ncbi:MAG: DUF3035 domain-containing protein [Gemmatimonas sp.]